MNNQILFELKENDATNKNNNGDYQISLTDDVIIEPGDSLILNSAFIDTKTTESNNYTLEDDMKITFQYCYYMMNVGSDNTNNARFYADYVGSGKNDMNDLTDGEPYILCSRDKSKPVGNYTNIQQLRVSTFSSSRNIPKVKLKYKYTDIHGEVLHRHIYIQAQNSPETRFITKKYNINILAEKGTFQVINSNFQKYYQVVISQSRDITAEYMDIYHRKSEIIIEKGIYTPDELSQAINEKMNVNTTGRINNLVPVNNNLLLDAERFYDSSKAQNDQNYYYIDLVNHKNAFYIANNYYIGTNQFDLEYDNVQGKFYFNYLHMPWYDKDGNIFVGFSGYNDHKTPNPTIYYKPYGSYSGILITEILTESVNGIQDYDDFFERQMGFDFDNEVIFRADESITAPKTIGASSSSSKNNGYTGYNLQLFIPKVDSGALDLENFRTSGYFSLDSGVEKIDSGSNRPVFYEVPTNIDTLRSTTTTTFKIYSSNSKTLQGQEIPYFLIELNIPYNNKLISKEKTNNNVYAIVNKYYSLDSYTSKEGSSIFYTHNGQPSVLSEFRVRILNPDYTLANLGPDNTVFVTLQKAVKQLENNK